MAYGQNAHSCDSKGKLHFDDVQLIIFTGILATYL